MKPDSRIAIEMLLLNDVIVRNSMPANTTTTPASNTNYDPTSDMHNIIIGSLGLLLALFSIVVALATACCPFRPSCRQCWSRAASRCETHHLDILERLESGKLDRKPSVRSRSQRMSIDSPHQLIPPRPRVRVQYQIRESSSSTASVFWTVANA